MAKYRVGRFLNDYKGYALTAVASALLTGIVSSWSHRPVVETEDLQPYPKNLQVYRVEGYNDNRPLGRVTMSDGRTELLSADTPEGTSFRSLRALEAADLETTQKGWRSRRGDMETRIKEAEIERTIKAASKPNNR